VALRFDPASRTIGLYADPERMLRVSDPAGRGLHIACGAALFNLRLAAAVVGRHPVVRLTPDADQPLLIAAVRLAGPCQPQQQEIELHAAIAKRRTNRSPFSPARCHPVRYAWFEEEPQLAVLSTLCDGRADWLRAGQAMQRAWLTATVRGVAVVPLTQPLETDDAWQVRDPRSGIEYPQMVLRFGYGLPAPRAPAAQSPTCSITHDLMAKGPASTTGRPSATAHRFLKQPLAAADMREEHRTERHVMRCHSRQCGEGRRGWARSERRVP
jgi:hypothetical protein